MGEGRDRRQLAELRGRRAERLAGWWLRLHGYRVVARDFRVPVGEIDIVARRGRLLAFVEVKRRDSLDAAAWSITPRQRRRIALAANAFLQRHPAYRKCDCRFDALLIAPRRFPRHLKDAWRPSDSA